MSLKSKEVLKTRYNGRVKKRQWEEDNRRDQQATESKQKCSDETFVRIKKRKVAMLLGYSGMDYMGMQRNPGVKTIEGDLHKALLDNNYITQEGYDQIQTVNFQRAARTDKNVSAVRQVISMKLQEDVDIQKINQCLPSFIRVFAIKRVTKGFDSKAKCDARTYIYMLPTFSFENDSTVIEDHKKYRVSTDTITKLNDIFKKFLGTHNFHNFTSKKYYIDPSSKRFIINFECGQPFVMNDMEFAIIKIKGQSFMLHQIRKMIGLCLAIVRGLTSDDIVEKTFGPDRYDIPMAPGLGLMLDQVHYDRYDERYGKDGVHETLTWDEYDNEVNAFREKHIFPNIINTEINDMPMASWLETLPKHSYAVRTQDSKIEDGDAEKDSGDDDSDVDEQEEKQDEIKLTNKEKT